MNIEITNNLKKANAITHNGCFHADELFCTVLMMLISDKVILARVPEVPNIRTSAIIYDIGGGQFDHHQMGCHSTRENGIMRSSLGKMWASFGRRILEEHYKCSSKDADIIYQEIDEEFVQSIDCVDNGQLPQINFPAKIKSCSSVLSDFYPNWNEVTPELENEKFLEALQIAYFMFNNIVMKSISKLKARDLVENAIEQSCDGILVLPKFMPWRTWTQLSSNPKARKINFVVFPDNRGYFTVSAVPKGNSKIKKMLLPESWAGLSDSALQKRSGIVTATFCHNQRHIGAAKTLLGAIEMAISAKCYVSKCS